MPKNTECKKRYSKMVIVSFSNGGTFVYRAVSSKPITIEAVAEYFEKTEGWSEARDTIELIDEFGYVDLEKPLPERVEVE